MENQEQQKPADPVPQQPASTENTPATTGAVVVNGSAQNPRGKMLLSRNKMLGLAGLSLVIGLATLGYVFGYYAPNRPENIYKRAFANSAVAYDALMEYVSDEQVAKQFKVTDMSGDFKVQGGEGSTDGTFNAKTDDKNAAFSATAGLGVTRLKIDGIAKTAPNTAFPDIYLKLSGLKGVGAEFFGTPQLDTLDNQWVNIDHSFFDMLASELEQDEGVEQWQQTLSLPKREDLTAALKDIGSVNKKYLFTDRTEKSVLALSSFVGKEIVDSKNVNHYKVRANKANLKAYVGELGQALDASKLGTWAKTTYTKPLSEIMDTKGLQRSIDDLKDSETYDLWVNTKTKLVYKLRLHKDGSNTNYTDIGLDYDGGADKPFFVTTHESADGQDSSSSFKATLNMLTNTYKFSFNSEVSARRQTVKSLFNLVVKPGNGAVKADAPSGALSLAEALQKSGLSESFGTVPTEDESMPTNRLDPFILNQ